MWGFYEPSPPRRDHRSARTTRVSRVGRMPVGGGLAVLYACGVTRGGSEVAKLGGLGLMLGMLASGCPRSAFECLEDAQCTDDSGQGRCETNGYCSFPDPECPSGRRYGEHSAGDLAGGCVDSEPPPDASSTSGAPPVEPSGETATGSTTTPGIPPTSSSGGPGSTTAGTTTAGSDPMELSFTDDEWDDEFAAGTIDGLTWDGDSVRLARGFDAGMLTSRAFDARQSAAWATLAWWARGPYGKPLPGGGAVEAGYAEDGVDMQGNMLLLRLDESGALASGDVTPDASGLGHDAVVIGLGWNGAPGRFDAALASSQGGRLLVDPTDFAFGQGDFSWGLWVRLDDDCSGGSALIAHDGAGATLSANVWLACLEPQSLGACSGSQGGRAVFSVSTTQSSSNGGYACGTADIQDGQWHHVVATKQGHASATLRVYVDGVLDSQAEAMLDSPLVFANDVELAIGAHPGGSFATEGTFDEVGIWSRALDAGDVAAMYRRGVLRLELLTRACDEPDCADDPPFEGPAGDGEPLLDPGDALAPGTVHPLMLAGQVFQYRARFERLAPGPSPGLDAVTVTAVLP